LPEKRLRTFFDTMLLSKIILSPYKNGMSILKYMTPNFQLLF